MSVPPISQFFTNKVNVQLKSGQRFEGLLARIDYKNNVVVLEDVEDLGNDLDKNCVPHDKKIPEKSFESENISQIFMKAKHFSQPKKYKKEEFWDATSEPQPQKEKKYRSKYDEGKKEFKPKRNYEQHNERNNNYRQKGEDRPYRKYQERRGEERQEQEDERGLR